MNNKPSICVIIPAWNAGATIARAVASALAEPEVAEIVIVDDCSPDDTVARARACDDGTNRLKILKQTENCGPSAARNRAIDESVSPWIALLDADDFFLPGRMAGLLAHAEEADLIADDLYQVPESAPDGPRRLLLGEQAGLPRFVTLERFVLSNVTRRGRERGELGFIKPLMRREFLARHGIRYDETMRLGEDYALYVRALAAGARLVILPAQGYVSVVRENSLSGNHSAEDLRRLRDCNRAIAADFALTKAQRAALRAHERDTDCRLQWRLLIRAVKEKNTKAALAAFARPWPVPLYLTRQLAGQLWRRGPERWLRLLPCFV